MVERHPRIAAQAGIQGNASIGHLDQFQFAVLILHKNCQNIRPVTVGVALKVLSGRDRPVAEIASPGERFNHDVLDGPTTG
jgi:hypothetical protein